MKKITQELTAAATFILEGKKVKVDEMKYPHDMFHPETGEKKVAKDEAEHTALADKGYTHDKPEVDEVAEPEAKGEKDFKAKHVVKKSGAETDGTIVKEANRESYHDYMARRIKEDNVDVLGEAYNKAKELKNIKAMRDLYNKASRQKFGVSGNDSEALNNIDMALSTLSDAIADYEDEIADGIHEAKMIEGIMSEIDQMIQDGHTAKDIAKKLKVDVKSIMKITGLKEEAELCEHCGKVHEGKCDPVGEESEKQKKYQAFFKKALAKFGVKSPSELEKDKRSEFFDYIDANYEADNESD